MNILTVTVSAAIMGTLVPGVMPMSIAPILTAKQAENFAAAETSAACYAAAAHNKYTLPDIPCGCELELVQDRTYQASCTAGEKTLRQTVTSAFTLLDEVASRLTITTDDDHDGFDDKTGLPTHYFKC